MSYFPDDAFRKGLGIRFSDFEVEEDGACVVEGEQAFEVGDAECSEGFGGAVEIKVEQYASEIENDGRWLLLHMLKIGNRFAVEIPEGSCPLCDSRFFRNFAFRNAFRCIARTHSSVGQST